MVEDIEVHALGITMADGQMADGRCLLKAAGTPTIKPLPVSSFDRLTLFPGEFSTRTSRSGMLSPAFTATREVVWKKWKKTGPDRTAVAARGKARHTFRVVNMASGT